MNFITGDSVPVPVGSASAIPSIDNQYDIGSSTKRWRDGRFVNLYTGSTNVGGELTSLGATKLSLTGGALTGQVTTTQTATLGTQLVHKAYVDTADALQLNLTGGALTGQVTTNQTPSAATQLVPKSYVDAGDALQLNLAGGALTGQVTTTQTPTLGTHLVPKSYVDSTIQQSSTTLMTSTITYNSAGALITDNGFLPVSSLTNIGNSAVSVTSVYNASDNPRSKIFKVSLSPTSIGDGLRSGYFGTSSFPTLFGGTGFTYSVTFGLGDTNTSSTAVTQMLVGISATTTAQNFSSVSGPSNATNIMGIGHDVNDSVFSFFVRGNAGGSKTATSFSCATPSVGWYTFSIHSPVNNNGSTGSVAVLTMTNEVTGISEALTTIWSPSVLGGSFLADRSPVYPIINRGMAVVGGVAGSAVTFLGRIRLSVK